MRTETADCWLGPLSQLSTFLVLRISPSPSLPYHIEVSSPSLKLGRMVGLALVNGLYVAGTEMCYFWAEAGKVQSSMPSVESSFSPQSHTWQFGPTTGNHRGFAWAGFMVGEAALLTLTLVHTQPGHCGLWRKFYSKSKPPSHPHPSSPLACF